MSAENNVSEWDEDEEDFYEAAVRVRDAELAPIRAYADTLTIAAARAIRDQAHALSDHMRNCWISVEQCVTCSQDSGGAFFSLWEFDVPAAEDRLSRPDARSADGDTVLRH